MIYYEFYCDGKWWRTTALARHLGVNPSVLSAWRKRNTLKKHLGIDIPVRMIEVELKGKKQKTGKPGRPRNPENDIEYANPILHSKPKHHIIYTCDMPYKYGIDYGRGHSKEEAVKDFLHSRKDSELNYKVAFVSQDYKTALNYMIYKMREEGINE